MLKEQLDKIMRPKAIAVVGASTKDHTIGSDIMKRLRHYKFNGKIYPINPKGGIIEEGTKVIYREFLETTEELINNTLEKRRLTAEKAKESFE